MEEKVRLKTILQKEQLEEREVDLAERYTSSFQRFEITRVVPIDLCKGWSLNGKHPSNSEPLFNRLMQQRFTMTLILMWMESHWETSIRFRTSIKSAHATRVHYSSGWMNITGCAARCNGGRMVKWLSRIVVASKDRKLPITSINKLNINSVII